MAFNFFLNDSILQYLTSFINYYYFILQTEICMLLVVQTFLRSDRNPWDTLSIWKQENLTEHGR